MKKKIILKSISRGLSAAIILLAVYFLILSLVSGSGFAAEQFKEFRYFVVSLAAGFGIQFGLYSYLRLSIHEKNISKGMIVTTGTTSTIAMISCCAHYLVNILPVLGATGLVTLVAQYQVKLFWVGILFNIIGIIYIASRIVKFFNPPKNVI
jgi:P-type Cu+ transporter